MASAQQQTKTDPENNAQSAQKPDAPTRDIKAAPPPTPKPAAKAFTDWASI